MSLKLHIEGQSLHITTVTEVFSKYGKVKVEEVGDKDGHDYLLTYFKPRCSVRPLCELHGTTIMKRGLRDSIFIISRC